jgi:hypothetical protein
MFCASRATTGPRYGVQCAWLDTMTGDIMYKQIMRPRSRTSTSTNQPTVVALTTAVSDRVLQSSGRGKTHNEKGANAHDYILEPQTDSFLIGEHAELLGSYHTHSSICSGRYGIEASVFGILERRSPAQPSPLCSSSL